MLYVHEYVDIVGEGARPYMEHVMRFDTEGAAGRGLRLFGTWQVVGVTGRWPQVVNLWEVVGGAGDGGDTGADGASDGWDGWRAVVRAANVERAGNRALAEWWEEAYATRTGGHDRLLEAASGSPSLEGLRAAGVRGSLFVHELSEVRPGAGPEYLAAMAETWLPVVSDHGHREVGRYEVRLTDVEVVTLWATDLDHHVGLQRSDDARVPEWRALARTYLTRWREELMVPCPGTPLAAP